MNALSSRGIVSSGSWFLFSSHELPELVAHQAAVATERGYLYCPFPAAGPWLEIDDRFTGDWPVTRLDTDDGRLFTSVMNPSSIYSAVSERGWMLGSSVFVVAAALGGVVQRFGYDEVTTVARNGRTAFSDVRRIPPFSEHCPCAYTEPLANDPIESGWHPTICDSRTAGTRLLDALKASVAALTSSDDAPPAVLLSGGVDSAALAWTAHELGLAPIAYSIGTAWGDEHDEAAELASHCGITHRHIDLTLDELLGAVRPSIRQLGHADPDVVDGILNVVAALRSGQIEETTVLTGWGSDILNAGLLDRQSSAVDTIRSLLTTLRRTQFSSAFSGLTAGACGYRLRHPYWHRFVVEASLAIDPSCKYGPREKQHLRSAMELHVPASVAWRKKVALHHGTGVELGLSAHFGGAREKALVYTEVFADLASRSVPELLDELGSPGRLIKAPKGAEPAINLAEDA